jgi:PAS domain S-box-containing protein
MPWQQMSYTIALVLAALTSGGLALYIWQRRHAPGAILIVFLMACAALWSIAYALQLASVELASEVFFAKVQYIGIVVIPVVGFAFALQYSGRGQWLRPRNIALLFVIPVITLVLVWTEAHELIWTNVRLEDIGGFSVKVSDYGAWFVVHFAYSYLLMLIGASLIVTMLIFSHDVYRRQAVALLIFALSPMVSNTLYVLRLNPFPYLDLTPFAFNISGLALAWGLFRFRLADLIPVAYSGIIESMDDSVIVLDSQDRVIELNPAAKRLMGESSSNAIGQPLEEAFPELANELDLPRLDPTGDDAVPRVEVVLGKAGSQRRYDAQMSRSADQLGHSTCKVIALRETTDRMRAEQKINEQNRFLKNVLESLTHPFYVVNIDDYRVELANSAARREDPMEGLICYALGHRLDRPCDPNDYPCPLEEVKNTKKPVTVEHLHYDKAGNPSHYEIHGYPVFDDDGNVIQMIEYCLDITKRKQMEEEVRASEEKYRSIFDNIIDAYGEVALDGTILEVSPSIKEIGGYSREELLGKSLLDYYVNPESRAGAIEEILQKGKMREWEFQFRHKDGRTVTFSFNAELVTDDDGTPIKTVGVMRDVTERKQVEEELRASEEKYHNIFKNIIDVYGEVALDGTILEASPSIEKIGGYSREEIIGTSLLDYHVNPESRAEVIEELLQTGKVKEWEFLLRHKEGHIVTFSFNVELVTDEDGTPIKTVGVMRDITERKRMEEELRKHKEDLEKKVLERTSELQQAVEQQIQEISERKKAEEKLRALIDVTSDTVYELDTDLVYTYMSPASKDLTGYTPEEHIGKTPFDFAPPDEAERLRTITRDAIESQQPLRNFENLSLHKDGRVISLETNASPITDDQGKFSGYIVTDRDITEKRRIEEELRLSEEKYRSMFWEAPDIFFTLDLETMIVTDANKYGLESVEYGPEMMGKIHISEIVHPDDFERSAKRLSDMVINKDRMPNFPLRLVTRTGKIRHIEQSGVVFWDNEGNAKTFMGLAHDVTERKQAEEEIRLSKERYERILDTSHDSISIADENARIIYGNRAHREELGCTLEEVNDLGPLTFIHEEDQEKSIDWFRRAMKGESIRNAEYRRVRKNGEVRQIIANIDPILWPGVGKAIAIVGRDITERKQAEEARRLTEERHRRILDSCHDMIAVIDENAQILYSNRSLHENTGYAEGDGFSTGLSFENVYHEDRERIADSFSGILNGKPAWGVEYRGIHSSGEIRWVEANADLIQWGEGQKAIVNVMRDITDRKEAEEKIRLSKERYEGILDSSHDMIVVLNKKRDILFANAAWHRDASYTLEEWAEVDLFDTIHEEDRSRIRNLFSRAFEGISVRNVEYQAITKDGNIKWIEANAGPIDWLESEKSIAVTARNITARKQSEEALEHSLSLLYATLESTADGILVTDLEGNITDFNQKLLEMWRIPEHIAASGDERRVLSYVRKQLADSEEYPAMIEIAQTQAHDKGFEVLKFKDGRIFEQHSKPQKVGEHIIGQVLSYRDITERRRMAESLQKSEEKYRSIFEQAADSILLIDADTGAILDFNTTTHENLGYTREEFEKLGMPDIEALESRKEIRRHLSEVREVGEDIFETKHRTKLGEIRDVHVNCRLVTAGGQPILQSIWRDITESKRAEEELRKSQEELRDLSLHLESLREEERTNISREIHDELGQALTALKMDAFWLAKRVPDNQDALVDKIKAMSGLIDGTIKAMKKISTELRPGLLDDLGLASAIEWQAEEFQQHMEIECETIITPQDISTDRDRSTAIFRIFQEALTNVGRHARATKITARLEEIDGQLKLTVRDNGRGIAKSETTKSGAFGLVGIRERATALKGEMKISGRRGKGTTITVTIPIEG